MRGGKVAAVEVQAAEKVYGSFTLTVRNSGGHSSLPVKENAIYRLAAGLTKMPRSDSRRAPMRSLAATSAAWRSSVEPQAADMRAVAAAPPDESAAKRFSAKSAFYNALLRTTCVATMLQGGHAENALPQTARATVNCRMLPDEDPKAVQQTLVRAVADPQIEIAPIAAPVPSPPSPLAPEVFKMIESASRPIWGGVPVMPFMETGATDGLVPAERRHSGLRGHRDRVRPR